MDAPFSNSQPQAKKQETERKKERENIIENDVQTTISSRLAWLQEHKPFAALSSSLLEAIASRLSVHQVAANHRLTLEDTEPKALYILRTGELESYRTRRASIAQTTILEPGTVIHLEAFLLSSKATQTIISLTDCTLWQLNKADFEQLIDDFPALRQALSQQLTDTLDSLSEQLAYEQEKQQALRPYLVTRVKRGVVGSSRYATRLRQNIREVTHSETVDQPSSLQRRHPVLIFGEPGLNKDNLAALIHFGSDNKGEPMIQVNCEKLRSQDLLG
ncbi:MAG: cyclic nucleotide-binding domain-containing protein, partial [Cyanobacteria bacterium J06649_4]